MRSRILFASVLATLLALVISCGSEDPVVAEQPTATISTWAGTGNPQFDGDGNTLHASSFYQPIDVEFTPTLGTFIVDWQNHRIRKLMDDGTLQTVIGVGLGDGPPNQEDLVQPWPGTECALNHPTDVFERNDGYLVLVSWHNHKLREWNPIDGKEFVIAGRGEGCSGDGGPLADALLSQPVKATQADDGTIYFVDQRNQVIRKIDPSGIISTVVGTSTCTWAIDGGFSGDGGPPKDAQINMPSGQNPLPGGGIALDSQGRLYISDTDNHRIRRVDFTANIITTVVGDGYDDGAGNGRYAGDGGDPLSASLSHPLDIDFDEDDRLYIADAHNHAIRVVDFEKNTINTIAGNGTQGYSGDGGDASKAQLNTPWGVAFDQSGNLYIADTFNNVFRKVKFAD